MITTFILFVFSTAATGAFGQPAKPAMSFGATAGAPSAFGTGSAFGAAAAPNGTTVKFEPLQVGILRWPQPSPTAIKPK